MQAYLKKTEIIVACFFIFHVQTSLCMHKITVTTEVTERRQIIPTPSESYQRECNLIDSRQRAKINAFIAHHKKYRDISPYVIIESELKNKARTIKNIREANLQKIKKAFVINDSMWATIRDVAEQLRIFEDAHKHLPLPAVTHDKKIPKTLRNILKTYLVKCGINPKRIIIRKNSGNQYNDGCPLAHWSFDQTLILPTDPLKCNPGVIDIPTESFSLPLDEQKAIGLFFAHLLNNRKFVSYLMLATCAPLFHSTENKVASSKSYKSYLEIHKPLAIIELALQNQGNAYLMNCFLKSNFFPSNSRLLPTFFYTLSAKIKRYWDTLELLDNYNSVSTRLTAKKYPTQEPVTVQEYELWKKSNNNPLCLPIKASDEKRSLESFNPFDVLATQSFNRQYVGSLEKILYDFFAAIINRRPIYEHLSVMCIAKESLVLLKQIDPELCTVEYLIQTYGKDTVQQALDFANHYASRKYKEFLTLD